MHVPSVLQYSMKINVKFWQEYRNPNRADAVGWSCWVYTNDPKAFEAWMEANMTGPYDCILRFNSGDPMHTVTVCADQDAVLFKLTWL